MSKADITAVATLAAHLAVITERKPTDFLHMGRIATPAKCAADAMALQRLGRNARSAHRHKREAALRNALMGIHDKADKVLEPYGLYTAHSPDGVLIIGLPGNTGGGDGFSI